jgi:hypothetical protein
LRALVSFVVGILRYVHQHGPYAAAASACTRARARTRRQPGTACCVAAAAELYTPHLRVVPTWTSLVCHTSLVATRKRRVHSCIYTYGRSTTACTRCRCPCRGARASPAAGGRPHLCPHVVRTPPAAPCTPTHTWPGRHASHRPHPRPRSSCRILRGPGEAEQAFGPTKPSGRKEGIRAGNGPTTNGLQNF